MNANGQPNQSGSFAPDRLKGHLSRPKRLLGLNQGLIGIILICWVLPVLLIVTIGGWYILNSRAERARSDVMRSTENAVASTRRRVESVIASSRKASYISEFGDAWVDYQKTGDAVELYSTVKGFLNQQYMYDNNFKNIIVNFIDWPEAPIYVIKKSTSTYADIMRYRKDIRDPVMERSKTLGTKICFFQQDNRLYMMRNMVDERYMPYAVLVMELDAEVLFEGLQNIVWLKDGAVWLGETEIVIKGSPQGAEQYLNQITPGKLTYQREKYRSIACGMESLTSGSELQYVFFIDRSTLLEQLSSMKLIVFMLLLLLVPLMGAVIAFLYHKVNQPIQTLSEASACIEKGEFGVQVDSEGMGSRDFTYLGNSFNAMSDKLKNQFQRIYREELALRDAKIMALQSQINPHFLNNTLEVITWEARLAEDVKVCQMLEALSTMLEAAMDRKHRPLVHLSEELMYVDSYLFIIRERLGKRLTVEKEIDPETLDCYIPRLVLQPLLENAVEHGINPVQKGTIRIRAYRFQDRLLLEIENDGVATPEDLEKIQNLLGEDLPPEGTSSGSLGIRNVHQRARIIYGPESGLSITRTDAGTTLSRLNIRFDQSGNNMQ